MTQEHKELVLKDLCARLPYGAFVQFEVDGHKAIKPLTVDFFSSTWYHTEFIKPYLRPMQSMTNVEREEYRKLCKKVVHKLYVADGKCIPSGKTSYRYFGTKTEYYDTYQSIDYLNSRHFDHRGLIGKKLALKAPKGMYKNRIL